MRTFPEHEIVTALEAWWDREVGDVENDPFSDPAKKETLYELLPTIDSLTVVNVLLEIEQIVGFELPVHVIKRGGYVNREEMVQHLVPGIRKLFESKRN